MTAQLHFKTTHPASYADFDQAPADYIIELVGGRIHALPRPKSRHVNDSSILGAELLLPFQRGKGGPGGWWILDEPEVHFTLDQEVTVPDLAGWRRERMPTLPEGHKFTVVPDWICEILSPTTREYDLTEKMPLYARHGVKWLWIIDPDAQWLDAYRLTDEGWSYPVRVEGAQPISIPPFSAISFTLFEDHGEA